MRELRSVVEQQNKTVAALQQEITDVKFQLGQQRRELNLVKVRLYLVRARRQAKE